MCLYFINKMSKKSYVTMQRNKKFYKVYLADVIRVHSILKKSVPLVPVFEEMMSPKLMEKDTIVEEESF